MAEAHANLANALQQMGNYDMGIIYYQVSGQFWPRLCCSYYLMSSSRLCNAACLVMQSAIRLKPAFTDAYNNMASALVQKGLIPQAMECYVTALSYDQTLVCSV